MSYWGNLFTMSQASSIALNSTSKRVAFMFTCPIDKTADVLYVYVTSVVGTPGFYQVGIQTTSGGLPTGTWLTQTYTAFLMAGAKVIDVPNVALSSGVVYALVIQYYSGTVDGSNYANITIGDANNFMVPYDCTTDNQLTSLYYDGSSWSDQQKDPVFCIQWSDLTSFGQPYYTDGIGAIYSTYQRGELFTPPVNKTINTIGMWVSKSTFANVALTIQLYNVTDDVSVASIIFTPAELTTSPAWREKSITQVTLLSTKAYRILAKSPFAIVAAYGYRVYFSWNPQGLEPWRYVNWKGENDYHQFSVDGGSTWDSNTSIDLPFRFTVIPVPPPARPLINKPLVNPILVNIPVIR